MEEIDEKKKKTIAATSGSQRQIPQTIWFLNRIELFFSCSVFARQLKIRSQKSEQSDRQSLEIFLKTRS